MKLPAIKLLYVHNVVLIVGIFLFGSVAAGDPPVKLQHECDSTAKPRPECLQVPSAKPTTPPPLSQSDQPAQRQCMSHLKLSRPCTAEETVQYEQALRDKQEQSQRRLEAEGLGRGHPLSREEQAKFEENVKAISEIRLKSNGKTLTFWADSKSYIFLDDEKYPVNSLVLTCQPKQVDGYPLAEISRPAIGDRGPGLYPVQFYAQGAGTCVLRNKDFAVTIVVQEH
jgi:hypothetical protein